MAGPIRIAILANGAQARREATLTGRAYAGMGRSLKGVAVAAGLTALTAKVVGFAKESISLEAKFSQTMNTLAAATNAPATEMESLRKLAMKLGADTSYSANESADAMLELAKAGLSTKTIMGGGVAGTLTLAAAGGTELATAATIASNALNTFNLQGRDMASVAAALAGGANASTASVESLGMGLQQVGPGARNAGLSLQETVAALSAFDAAGIKGSDAGTSLKTMLTRLVPQTTKASNAMEDLGLKYTDARGRFVPLTVMAERTRRAFKGLSEEQRTTAMAAIFGSDATRAATVLMGEGESGIRKYLKAVKDQGAAEKMAAARMSGTAGAMERLSGSIETAQLMLGQKLAPAVVKGSDLLADKLVPAMETTIDVGSKIGKSVAPAVKALADAFQDLLPDLQAAVPAFDDLEDVDKITGPLRLLSEIFADVIGLVDKIPGPLKEIGIQAGIAALILPRLAFAVATVSTNLRFAAAAAMSYATSAGTAAGRSAMLTAAMTRLRGAAGTAAGIGGLVALQQGMSSTNNVTRGLLTTLGGAAVGFSVGGPLGAAIGGGVGLLASYKTAVDRAEKSVDPLKVANIELAGTFDKITNAASGATRAVITQDLEQKGLLASAAKIGVSGKTITAAVMGETKARKELTAAVRRYRNVGGANATNEQIAQSDAAIDLGISLGTLTRKFKAEREEAQRSTLANRGWIGSLKGLPKDVRIVARQEGFTGAIKQVRDLAKAHRLTPKQISILASAQGIELTRKQIREIAAAARAIPKEAKTTFKQSGAEGVAKSARQTRTALEGVNKTKGDISGWRKGIDRGVQDGKRTADRGSSDLARLLTGGTRKAKADLGPFQSSLSSGLGSARSTASSGGYSVGSAIGAGMKSGIASWAGAVASSAASIVNAAVAAAKAAAESRSPSRKTMRLGGFMGEGLAIGMRRKEGDAKKAGRDLIRKALQGVSDGSAGVDKALGKVTSEIKKRIDLKDNKAEAKREKQVLASLKAQFTALKKNGQAQEAVKRKLEQATQAYKDLVQASKEYAASVKTGVQDYASVVGLGTNSASSDVSLTRLLSQLKARASNVERWDELLLKLRGAGLNKTSLQDLTDAGVESGLATAEAIASGGKAAITEINKLTAQVGGTASTLGTTMANTFHAAGIRAAQGLVSGLEKQGKQLDRVAERLADSLVRKVKKQLGIKSPSRVFRDIGEQTVKGLTLGLDETYVKRSGAQLAASLTKGFGTPALDAYAAAGAAGGGQAIHLTLSAQEVDQLRRGRELQADLDVWHGAGGRARA